MGKLRTSGANGDNSSSRIPARRSPKAIHRRPSRIPTSEKKRAGKVYELETQIAQLEKDLKESKDQLSESESCKKQAQQEAEEAKYQLAAMSAKLEESQQQLDELWACEESRIQELRKVSQGRDRVWESELRAIQKHHSMDSAALAAAMNENQKLKIQLHNQAKHAESARNEVLTLRLELSETLDLVEELKTQLNDSKDSEVRALELVSQTREQLETIKSATEKDAGGLTEEADGSDGKLGRMTDELGSALAANAEMESELRRLKVQAEQWRKAAEAAAAMVFGDNGGGKFVEQSEPFDYHGLGEKLNLPYSEDTEDESSNKKTSNMLKKIGVLLKKSQK